MKLKIGLIICFCIGLFIFQMDRIYYESTIAKPITTTGISSIFHSPGSIWVTRSIDEVNLIAQSIYYFDLAEIDSNNKKHYYHAVDNDGLYLVDIKVNLNSRYTSYYHEVYYSLDSSKAFTYDEKRFNPREELVFIIIIDIVVFMVLITFFVICTRRGSEDTKSE